MWKSLSITKKVWMSVGILVLGYFGSTVFGFYLGRQTEVRLEIIAEHFFPATRQGQFALTAFKEQVEGYYDAVMVGNLESLDKAQQKSEEVFAAIDAVIKLKEGDPDTVRNVFRIRRKFKKYNETASEVYRFLVDKERDGNVEAILEINNEELLKQTVFLAAEENALRTELIELAGRLTGDLRMELAGISNITRNQRYLNFIVFFAVVAVALFFISLIIYRSIKQPLEKTYMLENAVKQSIDGVAVADLEGYFRFINHAWATMHGYQIDEMMGQHFSILYSDKHYEQEGYEFIKEVFKKGNYTGEMIHGKKDGSSFPVFISLSLLRDENGHAISMIGIGKDITEKKKNDQILEDTRRALIEKAHQAGMADIATGTLHNVGNILNSVTTSSQMINEIVRSSYYNGLVRANTLLREHIDHIEEFICNDPKGRKLMQYYLKLEEGFSHEQQNIRKHVERLNEKVHAIMEVIAAQQTYAGTMSLSEKLSLSDIVEDSIVMQSGSLQKHNIRVLKRLESSPKVMVQKVKLIHILINLIENAKDAMLGKAPEDREMVFAVYHNDKAVFIRISDTGDGIMPENLERIFSHGFTTKETGHGFGLHSCANYMTEMGGRMWAESEGTGKGSTFILRFQI